MKRLNSIFLFFVAFHIASQAASMIDYELIRASSRGDLAKVYEALNKGAQVKPNGANSRCVIQ